MAELEKTRDATTYANGFAVMLSSPAGGNSRSSQVDDTLLVRRAQQGDSAAFEELVRHYDQAVLRLTLHITGSQEDAQDIYQEVFLRAYRYLSSFRFECSFYTWIYRIATNICLDHLRKRQLHSRYAHNERYSESNDEETVLDRVPDHRPGASPERALFARELGERIRRALDGLSPRERTVFELKHYQGLKLQTVAVILNTTENTIKNTLFRATHKLRVELAGVR